VGQDGVPRPGSGGYIPPVGGLPVARDQVTINGLQYGYGATGPHVTKVGQALVATGHGTYQESGPGPTWTDADTKNYGDAADGGPGATSLEQLLGTLPG
jgi:hypothetical protein